MTLVKNFGRFIIENRMEISNVFGILAKYCFLASLFGFTMAFVIYLYTITAM